MRLATFNLLHGRSLEDGAVEVARLRRAVARLDADVLGLQEVDRGQPRSGGHDLTALAAAALGGATYRFAPAIMGTPGARWRAAIDGDHDRREDAAYGIALVTRYPVLRWAVTRLPAAPVRSPVLIPGGGGPSGWPKSPSDPSGPRGAGGRVIWLKDEPRVLLAAVIEGPAGPMTVATTHLSFVPGWNGVQLRRVIRALRTLPAPRVLLGDLNLPGALPRWLTGWRSLAELPTYPVDAPRVQLDHVLATGRLPAVIAAQSVAAGLSDHRALVVELADSVGLGLAVDRRDALDERA